MDDATTSSSSAAAPAAARWRATSRPSGKRILLLERGDWLPRETENWDAEDGVRRQPLRLARTPGTTRDGKPFQPRIHYFVGGATKIYGAALYRLRHGGLRRAPPPRRHLARPGRSPTTSWSRTTRRPSSSTRSTARAARTRPSRRRARRTRSRPSSTSRASSSSPTTSPRPGYHPFHAPCGDHARRGEHAATAPASAARPATASRAWCTPSPTPRCSASGRRSSTRT